MPPFAPDAKDYLALFDGSYEEEDFIEAKCYGEFALDLYYHNKAAYPDFPALLLHKKLGHIYSLDIKYRPSELKQLLNNIGVDLIIDTICNLPTSQLKETLVNDCFNANTLLGAYFKGRHRALNAIRARSFVQIRGDELRYENLKTEDLRYLREKGFFDNLEIGANRNVPTQRAAHEKNYLTNAIEL